MFAKVLTVLSAASLVAATPLVPRHAAASGSGVAPTNTASVDVFSTELCVYAYGTASRKGGPKTTTVTKPAVRTTSTLTSTYTPSTTTTPHYVATFDYTVSKPVTKTTTVTVTPSAYVVPAASLQLPINSTELTPSKNKRQVAVQEAPYSNSTTSVTSTNSTGPATVSLPNGGVFTVSGPTPTGPATLYSCQVQETTTYYTTKVSTAKKTTTYTAVPVATSTKSIDVGTTRPIVTVTSTSVAATPTVYAACQPGWIVDEVDGYPVEGFANVGGVAHSVPAADCAYDCCVACQLDSTCLFSYFDTKYNTCSYMSGNYTYPIAWYVGSETNAYDSLSLAGGPAGDMDYCGFMPGCEMIKGKLVCPEGVTA